MALFFLTSNDFDALVRFVRISEFEYLSCACAFSGWIVALKYRNSSEVRTIFLTGKGGHCLSRDVASRFESVPVQYRFDTSDELFFSGMAAQKFPQTCQKSTFLMVQDIHDDHDVCF